MHFSTSDAPDKDIDDFYEMVWDAVDNLTSLC